MSENADRATDPDKVARLAADIYELATRRKMLIAERILAGYLAVLALSRNCDYPGCKCGDMAHHRAIREMGTKTSDAAIKLFDLEIDKRQDRFERETTDGLLAEEQRDELVKVLRRLVDARNAGEDAADGFRDAEGALRNLEADGYFRELPWGDECKLINKWIDTCGTAPPGVDPARVLMCGEQGGS